MKRRIAVDSRVLQSNNQTGQYEPPLLLIEEDGRAPFYRIDILDGFGKPIASVVYRPTREREYECWIETEHPVVGRSSPSAMLTGQDAAPAH
jgi:hypothetical protein